MAYQIDRYNNTQLTIVEDGTIDQTTDLKFIGKNYAGYGEIQNENFLFLLENFAGANEPPRAINGQVWFDSANSKLKFYDGSIWRSTGGSEVAADEPTGLTVGDFWWDTANEQLYVWNGSSFVLIGPQNAGEGITQMRSLEVLDDGSPAATKSIIVAYINDVPTYIISSEEFTMGSAGQTLLTGFDRIRKGLTLKWTKAADAGVTNSAGTSGNEYYYWGTASNADKLGGIAASGYITSVSPNFTSQVTFPDAGIVIGDDLDLRIYISGTSTTATGGTTTGGSMNGTPNATTAVIENQYGPESQIAFRTRNAANDAVHSLTLNSIGLVPASDNEFELGASSYRYANMYAVNFVGEATKATTLKVGSSYRTADTSASNNTVAVRDATGNLNAILFQGTATQARYADLAEVYSTDQEYPVGTVMAVGGDAETRAATVSDFVVGVISDKPAYLMNSDAEGQAIGLKGRVPVRVQGPVSKGQAVYAWQDGVASTIASNGMVGVALESNNDEGEKLVECVLKV